MRRVLFCVVGLFAICFGNWAPAEDKKVETKPISPEVKSRPSDVVFILIETSGADEDSVAELQRLYDVLRKLDKNNDGEIDPAELRVARLQIIEDRVDHIMKKLDTDGDGSISRSEAKGRILEHFDRLDLNADGLISRDELRQAISTSHKAAGKGPKN
jgi:hypothetical protein